MSEPFLGEIRLFAGNFAPRNWRFCDGSVLSISQNTALFSLIGVTYGGNGQTNFALPDLRGRAAVHAGIGVGLSPIDLGGRYGEEQTTLTAANLPPHTHAWPVSAAAGGVEKFGVLAQGAGAYSNAAANVPLAAGTVGSPPNGGQPFNQMQPYLALHYIICVDGVFPSRN